MRITLFLVLPLSVALFSSNCFAQDAQSSPTPTPADQSSQAVSPTPSPTPEPQVAPDLLPDRNTLPIQPLERNPALRDLIPQKPPPTGPNAVPSPPSAEQAELDRIRFREIRTIAVRNPYAIHLLRRAQRAPNEEAKREYLRVYYITMCDEMRKLEPRLKGVIDGFEAQNVGRSSPIGQRPTIPGRDLPRYKAIELREQQRQWQPW